MTSPLNLCKLSPKSDASSLEYSMMPASSEHRPFHSATTLAIANPVSGYPRSRQRGRRLIRLLRERGFPVAVTMHPGHGTELARGAAREGKTGIIVIGGDGTLCEAIAELTPDIALAYYPAGSGNNFAFNLQLPEEPEEWLRLLDAGSTRAMRFGLCNGQPFATVASVGFDALLVRNTPGSLKRRLSKNAYALAFWPNYFRYSRPEFDVWIDGRPWEGRDVLGVIVGRGRNYGGRHPILPACEPGENRLSYLIMSGPSKSRIPKFAIGMLLDNLPHMDGVVCGTAATVEVKTRPAGYVQLDGNLYGTNPVTFSVESITRRILAP